MSPEERFLRAYLAGSESQARVGLGATQVFQRFAIPSAPARRARPSQPSRPPQATTQQPPLARYPTGGKLPPEAYALLDTIAGTESPGYNVIHGGSRFEDYRDHPRRKVLIRSGPNAGKTSSAAGRYQFVQGTWDDQARKLGLEDFSPGNQDAAAWHLAQETYGQGLLDTLRSGDPARIASIGRALRRQWVSLPGGIEARTTNDRFASAYQKNLQSRLGADTTASLSPEEQFLLDYLSR